MNTGRQKATTHEQLAGLDIGSDYVAAAYVRLTHKGHIHVHQAAFKTCDKTDSADNLAACIRALWKHGRFPVYSIACCADNRQLIHKLFNMPQMQPEELKSAMRVEAEESLQQPPGNIYLDFHINDARITDQKNIEGVLVAAPKASVDYYTAAIQKARILPVIYDSRCMAVANLYRHFQKADQSSEAVHITFIGSDTADMCVLNAGGSIFPRSVTAQTDTWENKPGLLADHIHEHLKYFEFKLRHESVRHILLCGRVSEGNPLHNTLQDRLPVPVDVWEPLPDIKIRTVHAQPNSTNELQKPMMAAAVGLALRRYG